MQIVFYNLTPIRNNKEQLIRNGSYILKLLGKDHSEHGSIESNFWIKEYFTWKPCPLDVPPKELDPWRHLELPYPIYRALRYRIIQLN